MSIRKIYASSNDCGDLVHKINNDLENIRKWMIKNKECLGKSMLSVSVLRLVPGLVQ